MRHLNCGVPYRPVFPARVAAKLESPGESRGCLLACCSTNLSPIPLYIMRVALGKAASTCGQHRDHSSLACQYPNTIRSGLTDCATRTASCPFEASPHTSKSASRAKISARICRIKQLSSTTRTRLRCGCSWDDGSYRLRQRAAQDEPPSRTWGNVNSRFMRVPISKGSCLITAPSRVNCDGAWSARATAELVTRVDFLTLFWMFSGLSALNADIYTIHGRINSLPRSLPKRM